MLMDLSYLAGKKNNEISPVKQFDFFSIPKSKPSFELPEEPRVLVGQKDGVLEDFIDGSEAAPPDAPEPDDLPGLEDVDIETDDKTTEAIVSSSKKASASNNRRLNEMETFLTEILDPNLEAMCSAMSARPFCSEPGCREPCDLHCDSCVNFYCDAHHHDEGNTHSTRVWSDVPSKRKKTLLVPGFQESVGCAKIDATPSFCDAQNWDGKSMQVK